jgi:hypothetical protein
MRAKVAVLFALCMLSSCGGVTDPTEVVLVVTGDFSVPDEMDRVFVQVTGPDGTSQTAEAELTASEGFPRSLGLYNASGDLGPYRVEVTGFAGVDLVVRRRAVFDFAADRSLEVEVALFEACEDVTCLCNDTFCSTCGEGGVCTNAVVQPRPFDGVERGDADAGLSLELR